MTGTRQAILIFFTAVLLMLTASAIGGQVLWRALTEYHAEHVGKQIVSTLYREAAEGNLFGVTAALGRLQMSGVVSDVALVRLGATQPDWVYATNAELKISIPTAKVLIESCGSPRGQTQIVSDDKIRFFVELSSPANSHEKACVVAETTIGPELLRLKSLVWLVFGVLATASIAAVTFLLYRMGAQKVKIERASTKLQLETAQALAELASQVSHDIRSPLSALNMVLGSLDGIAEEKRLIIRNATQRINDIANNLLQRSKKPQLAENTAVHTVASPRVTPEPLMLVALLDTIVSEKRLQYRDRMGIDIHADLRSGYGIFVNVAGSELARAISNLVNNSVEAFEESGNIVISVARVDSTATITVADNGKGIPAEVLARLGDRGLSHGKSAMESGTGLGFYHARSVVEAGGGRVAVESRVGNGTTVTFSLPIVPAPSWFVEKLILPAGSKLISADDDQTIHQVWRERLTGLPGNGVEHIMFSSATALDEFARSPEAANAIFLIDYEFIGQRLTGLDVIDQTGIASRSILVTSRYDERYVRSRAEALGVWILPKALAPIVPIEKTAPKVRYHAIVIDDDVAIILAAWNIAAKESGRNVACFADSDQFFRQCEEFDKMTPLYIDVCLANGVRGEKVAEQAMIRGFTNVYLATGHEPTDVAAPLGLRGIVGKDPVF